MKIQDPKLDKSVLWSEETYGTRYSKVHYFDHQILNRLSLSVYVLKHLRQLLIISKDAIITRLMNLIVKKLKKTVEVWFVLLAILLSGNGFIGQSFIKYDDFLKLIEAILSLIFHYSTTMPIKLNHIIRKFSANLANNFMGNIALCVRISWYVNIISGLKPKLKVERMQAMLVIPYSSITKLHRSMSSGQAVIIEGSLSGRIWTTWYGIELSLLSVSFLKSKQKKATKTCRKLSQILKN